MMLIRMLISNTMIGTHVKARALVAWWERRTREDAWFGKQTYGEASCGRVCVCGVRPVVLWCRGVWRRLENGVRCQAYGAAAWALALHQPRFFLVVVFKRLAKHTLVRPH